MRKLIFMLTFLLTEPVSASEGNVYHCDPLQYFVLDEGKANNDISIMETFEFAWDKSGIRFGEKFKVGMYGYLEFFNVYAHRDWFVASRVPEAVSYEKGWFSFTHAWEGGAKVVMARCQTL